MIWMSVSTPCDSNIIVNCFRQPCIYPLLHHVIACLLTSFSCPATQATPHLLLQLAYQEAKTKRNGGLQFQPSCPTLNFFSQGLLITHGRPTSFKCHRHRQRERILTYICTFASSNIIYMSLETLWIPESLVFGWVDIGNSSQDFELCSVQVVKDNFVTKLQEVEFSCSLDLSLSLQIIKYELTSHYPKIKTMRYRKGNISHLSTFNIKLHSLQNCGRLISNDLDCT